MIKSDLCLRYSPLILSSFLLGCAGKTDVSGQVTYKGKPATIGWVLIVDKNDESHSGRIEPDGTYRVKDVAIGDAKVAVTGTTEPIPPQDTRQPPTNLAPDHGMKELQERMKNQKERDRNDSTARTGRIPMKYGHPLESGLTCQVKRGGIVFDIKLD